MRPTTLPRLGKARSFVEAELHGRLPRDAIALVVNSVQGRSQDQLHIHIDCIRPDVREPLGRYAAAIGTTWTRFPVPLVGRNYLALRISAGDLEGSDPFKLLASGLSDAEAEMGLHTLILARTSVGTKSEFLLLDRRVSKGAGDHGNGTELLDRACTLASAVTPPVPSSN